MNVKSRRTSYQMTENERKKREGRRMKRKREGREK